MAATKTGVIKLYFDFADSHVHLHEKKGTVEKISRAKVELQLLNEIEKAEFPIEYKLSWYHAVLVSSEFDTFWRALSERYKLPESCTTRYLPDKTLLDYEPPTDDEAEEVTEKDREKEIRDATAATNHSPSSVPPTPALITDHNSPSSTPDSDCSSRSSATDTDPELKALKHVHGSRIIPKCAHCNVRGHSTRQCPFGASSRFKGRKILDKPLFDVLPLNSDSVNAPYPALRDLNRDPRPTLGNVSGSAREEGDDGEYEESPSKSEGQGKAKVSSTVKSASKPTGVTKTKSTPKKKEQTPAQLLTAAAKTREPAKPKAIKKARTKKSATDKAAITPGQASYNARMATQAATEPDEVDKKIAGIKAKMGPAQEAGIKRMWEQFPDDEDDSPATKRGKTGGAASANGGRKKATPKGRKQEGLQEWDGIHRGFGEY